MHNRGYITDYASDSSSLLANSFGLALCCSTATKTLPQRLQRLQRSPNLPSKTTLIKFPLSMKSNKSSHTLTIISGWNAA